MPDVTVEVPPSMRDAIERISLETGETAEEVMSRLAGKQADNMAKIKLRAPAKLLKLLMGKKS